MDQKEQDAATIAMLLERLTNHRLPRARRMLERVIEGGKLSAYDLNWLKELHDDSVRSRALVERNPEYSKLVASAIDLYAEITTRALKNEEAG